MSRYLLNTLEDIKAALAAGDTVCYRGTPINNKPSFAVSLNLDCNTLRMPHNWWAQTKAQPKVFTFAEAIALLDSMKSGEIFGFRGNNPEPLRYVQKSEEGKTSILTFGPVPERCMVAVNGNYVLES